MNGVALRLENISKYYRLGVINNGTFRQDLKTWIALKTGKEDPNAKIGMSRNFDEAGFWALNDITADIHQGDRVGIIGKNGAGKSTLLKIISGITTPTKGNIKIKGRISSLLEVGTGFNPELTGRENIYLNGAILGMKKKEVDRKIDEIIAFSEIERHIDTPVKRYSSGMYVRLAFAVAAYLDSEILIADEVLAVGDAAFQKKALGKMNELSSGQGRTVLFVSHNMAQIKNLCNKGFILDKGRLLRIDDDINKSISYYLGTDNNGNELVTTSWKNDGSFYNENFCPQLFSIVDDEEKTVTSLLDYNKSYRLKLETDVSLIDSNVDFWFEVYAGTEVVARIDMPKNNMYKLGKNIYEWNLPEKSFLPGTYILSLGSSLKNVKYILDPRQFYSSLHFTVSGETEKIFVPLGDR